MKKQGRKNCGATMLRFDRGVTFLIEGGVIDKDFRPQQPEQRSPERKNSKKEGALNKKRQPKKRYMTSPKKTLRSQRCRVSYCSYTLRFENSGKNGKK